MAVKMVVAVVCVPQLKVMLKVWDTYCIVLTRSDVKVLR